MKNVVITILAILVLILGGYLVYDKFIVEEENNNQESNVENNDTNNQVVSYVEEKNGIPYITLDGFNSENDEISKFYNNNMDKTYEYHVAENILFINIEKSGLVTPNEGSVEYLDYYIDLTNNKKLSVAEVFKTLNIDKNAINLSCPDCSTYTTFEEEASLKPVGGLLMVECTGMGGFSTFRVNYSR